MAAESSISTAKRNRMIAIAAGAITVIAIVLAFASGYLGEHWLWLRPAGELLLLTELVGLIVLERHQLFEPVHESVGTIRTDLTALRAELSLQGQRLDAELTQLTQRLDTTGQMAFLANPSQVLPAITRALQEALVSDQDTPQILRWARLANNPLPDTRTQKRARSRRL